MTDHTDTPPPRVGPIGASDYITPRCSIGDHARCPDGPDPAYPGSAPGECSCECGHRGGGPRLPAEAFG